MAKKGRVKRSNLLEETIMYSINKDTGEVVTHHLPYARGNILLEHYLAKGFTYECPQARGVQPASQAGGVAIVIKHRGRPRKVKG